MANQCWNCHGEKGFWVDEKDPNNPNYGRDGAADYFEACGICKGEGKMKEEDFETRLSVLNGNLTRWIAELSELRNSLKWPLPTSGWCRDCRETRPITYDLLAADERNDHNAIDIACDRFHVIATLHNKAAEPSQPEGK